jgi:hypothetical protein
MARASEVDATLALFAASIGDVEQTLAGEEHELDQYLSKQPGSDGMTQAPDLPGHAILADGAGRGMPASEIAPEASSPTGPGHDRTNQVLRQRLAAARAGKRSQKPQRKLT